MYTIYNKIFHSHLSQDLHVYLNINFLSNFKKIFFFDLL